MPWERNHQPGRERSTGGCGERANIGRNCWMGGKWQVQGVQRDGRGNCWVLEKQVAKKWEYWKTRPRMGMAVMALEVQL